MNSSSFKTEPKVFPSSLTKEPKKFENQFLKTKGAYKTIDHRFESIIANNWIRKRGKPENCKYIRIKENCTNLHSGLQRLFQIWDLKSYVEYTSR